VRQCNHVGVGKDLVSDEVGFEEAWAWYDGECRVPVVVVNDEDMPGDFDG